jgi:hypothetical protein
MATIKFIAPLFLYTHSFDVRVDIGFMGIGTPDEIDVDVAMREIQSDNEARIFFAENEELNELTQTATLTPMDTVNFHIYLLVSSN